MKKGKSKQMKYTKNNYKSKTSKYKDDIDVKEGKYIVNGKKIF